MKNTVVIIGFDEVGRGSLAGPVVVGCVLREIDSFLHLPRNVIIRDSKRMTRLQRKKTYDFITQNFPSAVGKVKASEVDELGIVKATTVAAQKAWKALTSKIDLSKKIVKITVDGKEPWIPGCKTVIGGDSLITEISMASIVAKVTRDNEMAEMSKTYPQWGFECHVGYGTKLHCNMIRKHGLLEGIHRRSFCSRLIKQLRIPHH
ncbi:MAG: ribonuclease HII [Patescibacteria group bacterium]|jgi:ribonuclease HII